MKKKNTTISKTAQKNIKVAKRADGWANVLTGLGVKGMDKRLSAEVLWERLPEVDADNYYSADDIARKIVDSLVDEAFREGFNLTGVEKEQADALMKKFNDINSTQKLATTWKMARQYGGAGALLITDDMANMEKPLSETAFLKGLTPLSMWELYATYEDMDFNILSPSYFTPKFYTYQPRHSSDETVAFQKIHNSRVIRFDGSKLSKRFMSQNNYWSDSVLNALINSIRNYQLSHDAAASVVQDFRIAVFKIKDLADKIGADDDDAIIKRMEIVNLTRSIARSVLIDADGEEFDYKMGTVTGVKDILDKVENRLVGGTNIPRTILLGESPTGLGGSGRHEQANWYDYVASQQEAYLKPKLIPIFQMFGRELKIDTSNLDIVFNPLWQMTEKETAEIRKLNAESDNIYLTNGVVDSDEVALSRFGGEKYGSELEIDKSLRVQEPVTPEAQNSVTPGAEDIQKTALNGAQVSSMVEIVQAVATGNLPRESGISMLMKAFNLTQQDADSVMGSAGNGFKPSGAQIPTKMDGAFKELEIDKMEMLEPEDLEEIEDGGPGSGPQGGGGGKSHDFGGKSHEEIAKEAGEKATAALKAGDFKKYEKLSKLERVAKDYGHQKNVLSQPNLSEADKAKWSAGNDKQAGELQKRLKYLK